MWVQQAMDARWFADRAHPWLDRFGVESNVLATWLEVELSGRPRQGSRWWLVWDDAGGLAGIAFQARNLPLQLAPMTPDAAAALALHYAHHGLDPLGVSGVATSAQDFAITWQTHTRARIRLTTVMRIHALNRLLYPRTPGIPRLARPEDADLCETWLTAYTSEVHPEEYRDTLRPMVERRLRNGELWFWEHHGEPVAVAGVTHAVCGVARVAPVYTPPVSRRRGYGAAAAAAATAAALEAGARTCMLFTDLTNPAVSALYQRLGFRPIADAARYDFEPVLLPRPMPLDPSITTPPAGVSPVPPMPLEPPTGEPEHTGDGAPDPASAGSDVTFDGSFDGLDEQLDDPLAGTVDDTFDASFDGAFDDAEGAPPVDPLAKPLDEPLAEDRQAATEPVPVPTTPPAPRRPPDA